MILYPAIDLKDGQAVRLVHGDMDQTTVFNDDPAAQAMLFAEAGAEHLHVVDLDGSFAGSAQNREAVQSIVEAFPGYVQLGGGIRTRADVEGWFDAGVARIVIGTAALKDPDFVKEMAREFEGGIVVAVDARDGMVATDGWAEQKIWGMGITSRDITGNGLPDVMLTSMGDQILMTNDGQKFTPVPYTTGTYAQRPFTGDDGRPSTSWHSEFGDINNDGRADLFIAKGKGDQMPGLAMLDPNNLLMQNADGTFSESAGPAGIGTTHRSRGAALADLAGEVLR